jgi:hypothetical protein
MNETNKAGVFFQEIKVKGNQLVDKVREIVEEGNARRVIIKKDGRNILEFPLSVGVGGATAAILLAPTLAAIGAFAALVTDVQVVVAREKENPEALITTSTEMPKETAESSDPSI